MNKITITILLVLLACPVATTHADDIVLMTQQRLIELGWLEGVADGAMGPKTRAAISEFQSFMNIDVTGEPTDDWVPGLFIPCQVRFTATGGQQAMFGCVKPAETEDEGMVLLSVEAPPPSYLGRTPCTPPKLEGASSKGLRTDGFYQSATSGWRTFVRFYPDGKMTMADHYDPPRFIPCVLSRARFEGSAVPPQDYRVEAGAVTFAIPNDEGERVYKGVIHENRLTLNMRQEKASGGVMLDGPRDYTFFADPVD